MLLILLISDPLTYALVFMLLVGLPTPLCKYAAARCEQCWWWVIQFKGGKQVCVILLAIPAVQSSLVLFESCK